MTTPMNTWTRDDGSVVRVFATDEPFKFRVTVDHKPFNMNKAVTRGGTKGA